MFKFNFGAPEPAQEEEEAQSSGGAALPLAPAEEVPASEVGVHTWQHAACQCALQASTAQLLLAINQCLQARYVGLHEPAKVEGITLLKVRRPPHPAPPAPPAVPPRLPPCRPASAFASNFQHLGAHHSLRRVR